MKKDKIAYFFVFLITLLAINFASASPNWWNSDWQYRMPLIVNQSGAETLYNFPIVVNGFNYVNTAELISAGKMKAECGDIRFVDSSGAELAYEFSNITDPVYGCNTNSTLIYLKIPTLPADGTLAYMYYGNPSVLLEEGMVWDENYSLVVHPKENSGAIIKDSSSADNNGGAGESWEKVFTKGIFGNAFNFSGNMTGEEYIYFDYPGQLHMNRLSTIEIWVKRHSEVNTIFVYKRGEYEIMIADNLPRFNFWESSNGQTIIGNKTIDENEWNYISVTSNGTEVILYLNGAQVGEKTVTNNIYINSYNLTIGSANRYYMFLGQTDEFKFSNTARSSDWIKRSYQQELSSFGSEEASDSDSDGVTDSIDNCPYVYNPDQTDADENGIGDVCDCMPNWIQDSNSCSILDNLLVSYTDSNQCGKNYELPADNGTYLSCDYCSESIQGPFVTPWSSCSNNSRSRTTYFIDLNFLSCCSITHLATDCNILTPAYQNSTETSLCDDDSDGIPNNLDICPSTPTGLQVDSTGCSAAQFCDSFNPLGAKNSVNRTACKNADWLNNEAGSRKGAKDCTIDTQTKKTALDDICIASTKAN